MGHTFHIPVLGIAFTIDTPIKVAHLGISSVMSIVDDMVIERMRKYYLEQTNQPYHPITDKEHSFRSKRITAYLNLVQELVDEKIDQLKKECFEKKGELVRYFELLPEQAPLKKMYRLFVAGDEKVSAQALKDRLSAGAIDVNIMAKVDKLNRNGAGEVVNSDALESLKGFAESKLNSSVVLSAGMNPKLYSYIESFPDFFPEAGAAPKKRIILKVSDYRSALIQAKFLAKKGIWITEFRIESGLNCGGHAFATEGLLAGPILEDFKRNRVQMKQDLFEIYRKALAEKGLEALPDMEQRICYQGGVGTAEEHNFLMAFYGLDGTGWGSPFLLVPEATTVDESTLSDLATATKDDFYISGSSPLGVPFNNFRKSSIEKQRLERIAKGRPGSPCVKKLLVSNTEFTTEPICTASRQFQELKIKQLDDRQLSSEEYREAYENITEKACLCEGLAVSAYIKYDILKPKERDAVAICPGPNTAYFSGVFNLDEMVKHIYGHQNLLEGVLRPHVFINELHLYLAYVKKEISMSLIDLNDKKLKYFQKFKEQLAEGIAYYRQLLPQITALSKAAFAPMKAELSDAEDQLKEIFSRLQLCAVSA